jgi:hypothetical protein
MPVTQGADILSAVATRKPKPSDEKPRPRSGASIQAFIDPDIRAAMDAYMAAYNSQHDHRASVTSTIEAALKRFLAAEGHWPPKSPRP